MEFKFPDAESRYERKREIYQSLKAKADARRSATEKIADKLTQIFGTMTFLILNMVWFAAWIIANVEIIPGLEPFDPFPFGFLTMIVSLEAIGLAIIVLISQNRAAKIGDLRQEVDLSINVKSETEITKILQMVRLLLEKNGVDVSEDKELAAMLRPTDLEKVEEELEKEVIESS